jgi:transposase-like protein
MLEKLNKEIGRRTRVIGIFPNPDSYVCFIATYLMEYAEDWTDSRTYFSAESMQNASPTTA